jgi:hypothetical protein
VVVVAVGNLLASALRAGVFTTVDARVVEVGVERAEVAAAAIPQSCHVDVGSWWWTGWMGRWNGWQSCWSAGGYGCEDYVKDSFWWKDLKMLVKV